MNIDEMQAGREMDALIAEIMGYKAWKETRGEYTLAVMQRPKDREPWTKTRYEYQEKEKERYVEISCLEAARMGFFGTGFPDYSTDIAAAWEAWEWLKEQYHEINITYCKGIYYLTIFDDHGNCLFGAEAETFPLAICRAALKALGVEA